MTSQECRGPRKKNLTNTKRNKFTHFLRIYLTFSAVTRRMRRQCGNACALDREHNNTEIMWLMLPCVPRKFHISNTNRSKFE